MPQINIELGSHTVEATVTLSVTRLNDILRIIMDQSNLHEQAIDELRTQLAAQTQRTNELATELERLKPEGDKMEKILHAVERSQLAVERLRQEMDAKIDAGQSKLHKRIDSVEAALKAESELRERETSSAADGVSRLSIESKGLRDRLDKIVVPDMRPLIQSVEDMQKQVTEAATNIGDCVSFVALWSPDYSAMRAVSKSGDVAEKVRFVHGLPPMEQMRIGFDGQLAALRQASDDEMEKLRRELRSKAGIAAIVDLKDATDKSMRELLEKIRFADRRITVLEPLPERVSGVEGVLSRLHHNKADVSQLDLKADVASLHLLADELSEARQDIDDLFSKAGSHHATTGTGTGTGLAEKSAPQSSGGIAARRTSAASSGVNDDLMRKRLDKVEVRTEHLEKDKVDRAEWLRLQEYLEHLENTVSRRPAGGGGGDSVPEPPTLRPTRADRVSPVRPPSGNTSASRPQSGGIHLTRKSSAQAAAELPLTPSRPASGRTAAGATGALSAGGGSIPTSPGDLAASFVPIVQAATIFESVEASEVGAAARAGGSAGAAHRDSPRVGNSWHIGRGSIGVRDSSGSTTPASVVYHAASGTQHHPGLMMSD